MAFLTANDAGYIVKDYKYQRYPLVMHKGQHPNIQSIHVKSEQEEKAAAAKGFSLDRPSVAEPVPERPTLSLEERLDELEERIAVLEERLIAPPADEYHVEEQEADQEDQEFDTGGSPNIDAPRRGRGRPRKVASNE